MKSKKIICLLLTMIMILMAACSNEKANTETITESNGDKSVELLKIGTTKPNDSFSTMVENGAFGKMGYNSFVMAPFIELDENYELQPNIMKTWEISDDLKSVTATFAVDEGIMWHDGEPLTIEDIVFTFEYNMNVRKSSYIKQLSSVEKIDEKTLKFSFEEPAAFNWLNSIARFFYVQPKHVWENIDNPKEYTGEDAAIGCGPYKFVSYDKDAQTSYYEAVDNYFKGDITVKSVSVKTYDSHDSLIMALKNGDIDAMYDYSNSLDAVKAASVINVENVDSGMSDNTGNYQLVFGFRKNPTDDLSFRQAVTAALDYNILSVTIGGEYGEIPGTGIIAPPNKGFDATLPKLQQDVEKSSKILDEGGYLDIDGDGYRENTDGKPMDVSIVPQYNATRQALYLRIAEVIIQNLDAVGIKAHIDSDSVNNVEYNDKIKNEASYELFIGYTSPGMAAYDSAFGYIADNSITGQWGSCNIPEFIEAYQKMKLSSNYDEYKENIKELQRLTGENAIALALCWDKAFFPFFHTELISMKDGLLIRGGEL
nr:ABC transporter substrate-binding protein [Sedimentibacter sp.]